MLNHIACHRSFQLEREVIMDILPISGSYRLKAQSSEGDGWRLCEKPLPSSQDLA